MPNEPEKEGLADGGPSGPDDAATRLEAFAVQLAGEPGDSAPEVARDRGWLDENGAPLRALHDPGGETVKGISAAEARGGVLYLGMLEGRGIGRLRLDDAGDATPGADP